MYKLSRDSTGLCCTESGLTYGDIALVAKAGNRCQPCRPEIDSLARAGLAVSPTGLQSVVNFLNRGNLGGAMIAALHLRLPDLEQLAQLAKAGFDPSQPRDGDGMWTSDGGDAVSSDSSPLPPASQPRGTNMLTATR
jgi:hypothetical protein